MTAANYSQHDATMRREALKESESAASQFLPIPPETRASGPELPV